MCVAITSLLWREGGEPAAMQVGSKVKVSLLPRNMNDEIWAEVMCFGFVGLEMCLLLIIIVHHSYVPSM